MGRAVMGSEGKYEPTSSSLGLFLHYSLVDLLLVLLETVYLARDSLVRPLAAVPIIISLV